MIDRRECSISFDLFKINKGRPDDHLSLANLKWCLDEVDLQGVLIDRPGVQNLEAAAMVAEANRKDYTSGADRFQELDYPHPNNK